VQFAIGDMYKGWNVAPQIQQGMKFDRGFGGACYVFLSVRPARLKYPSVRRDLIRNNPL
jgi:hypothetical protein